MMDTKDISKNIGAARLRVHKYWMTLQPRTKMLYVFFMLALGFSFALNVLIKPQHERLYQLKQEAASLNNRVFDLTSRLPDVDQEERLLQKEQVSLKALSDELAALESQLPQQDSLPELLGELVKQSSGYVVDFNLIKPVQDKGKEEYQRLNIELRFSSNFAGLVNYLKRLERISPFIVTKSVRVEEQHQKSSQGLDITVVLSTLLSEGTGPVSKVYRSPEEIQVQPFELKRNPFYSNAIPQASLQIGSNYVLTGIISQGAQPTAIINDEVYKVGDKIGETLVKNITNDAVVLQEGPVDITLTISQE